MLPQLARIDHVHVYVRELEKAEAWYEDILGFQPDPKYAFWNTGKGPLMMNSPGQSCTIALFESDHEPSSIIAFGCNGSNFLGWLTHLKEKNISVRVADHTASWSMYFDDPFGNNHEITTYDYDVVLASGRVSS